MKLDLRSGNIGKCVLWALYFALVGTLTAVPPAAPRQVVSKTMRVEHGFPVVLVSDTSVLVLEFLKEPIASALIPHSEENVRHCRARYRFQWYNGATGSTTNGEGMVEEVYQRDPKTGIGKDAGSHTGLGAGEFHLSWSEGGAGARSWIYYRTESPIRFIQQPKQITYESVDAETLRRYLQARNVREYVAAGKTVRVIGPAVFSGDLPTEAAPSARIEFGRVRDNTFELKLTNLATNKHYIVETSYEVQTGNWSPVHTFIAQQSEQEWSDPLTGAADVTFYRVREGAY